jgi:hypothetical protein
MIFVRRVDTCGVMIPSNRGAVSLMYDLKRNICPYHYQRNLQNTTTLRSDKGPKSIKGSKSNREGQSTPVEGTALIHIPYQGVAQQADIFERLLTSDDEVPTGNTMLRTDCGELHDQL